MESTNRSIISPEFCFCCGNKIKEIGLGYKQCIKCEAAFLPFVDDNIQCLGLANRPLKVKPYTKPESELTVGDVDTTNNCKLCGLNPCQCRQV